MRSKIVFCVLSVIMFASVVEASMVEIRKESNNASREMELNIDRPGSDYMKIRMPSGSPASCQSACYNKKRCKAWTFVKKNVQGPTAMCYLKDGVPLAQRSKCCTSGVASKVKRVLEYGYDRTGGDYKNFATGGNPLACLKACDKDGKCKSFTYVRKGAQGKQAQCYLKNVVPKKRKAKCCISAVFPTKKEARKNIFGGNVEKID